MNGKLYGIGVGPGDPELLTVKAIKTIEKCRVIAVPEPTEGDRTAFSIVEKYLVGKELFECRFEMTHDMEKRKKARQIVAETIVKYLEKGKDVGFITLGDPTTYSTYMYIHSLVKEGGYEREIVPGITSFAAAAAAHGISLCEGGETLTLIPASHAADLDELLARPGNKVIMKSGRKLETVLSKLKELGYGSSTKIAYRAAMADQRLFGSIEDFEKSPESGYFTLAIVKERK